MPNISKAKKSRLAALEKAKAKNPNHQNQSMNEAMIFSMLEMSDDSDSDITPGDLHDEDETSQKADADLTPDLTPELMNESSDTDFSPLPPKNMVVPDSFLVQIMKNVACIECGKPGGIIPSVTKASEFQNEVTFTCRCKHSFNLQTFPDTNINEVLIRNAVANGIPKQPFQRFLQVGNFGANVDGKELGINLFSRRSMNIYKQQNQVIIDGAKEIHKNEVTDLFRANKAITISGDGSYPKRGYHSPAGHVSFICNKKVIDAATVKRGTHKSDTAYGDIQPIPANKIEQYGITQMLKHLIPHIGPLITQIDLDQDASLYKVIENMKWSAEDVETVNKWTGKKEITEDMIGKSVWGGKMPKICFDKVSLFIKRITKLAILENQNGHFRLFWYKIARMAILENQIGHFRLF